jgi:hypothetical protein
MPRAGRRRSMSPVKKTASCKGKSAAKNKPPTKGRKKTVKAKADAPRRKNAVATKKQASKHSADTRRKKPVKTASAAARKRASSRKPTKRQSRSLSRSRSRASPRNKSKQPRRVTGLRGGQIRKRGRRTIRGRRARLSTIRKRGLSANRSRSRSRSVSRSRSRSRSVSRAKSVAHSTSRHNRRGKKRGWLGKAWFKTKRHISGNKKDYMIAGLVAAGIGAAVTYQHMSAADVDANAKAYAPSWYDSVRTTFGGKKSKAQLEHDRLILDAELAAAKSESKTGGNVDSASLELRNRELHALEQTQQLEDLRDKRVENERKQQAAQAGSKQSMDVARKRDLHTLRLHVEEVKRLETKFKAEVFKYNTQDSPQYTIETQQANDGTTLYRVCGQWACSIFHPFSRIRTDNSVRQPFVWDTGIEVPLAGMVRFPHVEAYIRRKKLTDNYVPYMHKVHQYPGLTLYNIDHGLNQSDVATAGFTHV